MTSAGHRPDKQEKMETINGFLMETFKKYDSSVSGTTAVLTDDANCHHEKFLPTLLRTEDAFTVTDKNDPDSSPKIFEKRMKPAATRHFNVLCRKPIVEKDVICLDLEPRARYYYVHVMAKWRKNAKF